MTEVEVRLVAVVAEVRAEDEGEDYDPAGGEQQRLGGGNAGRGGAGFRLRRGWHWGRMNPEGVRIAGGVALSPTLL